MSRVGGKFYFSIQGFGFSLVFAQKQKVKSWNFMQLKPQFHKLPLSQQFRKKSQKKKKTKKNKKTKKTKKQKKKKPVPY